MATARRTATTAGAIAALALTALAVPASAGSGPDERTEDVVAHWTEARREAAQPRDLVLDQRGRAFLRDENGQLEGLGHDHAPTAQPLQAEPNAKPVERPGGGNGGGGGGSSDTDGPTVTNLDPDGTTIGSSATFSATVTDPSGVKSVNVVVEYPAGSSPQSFRASNSGGDTWSVTLSGFSGSGTAGAWHVEAKDGAKRGGNTTTSADATFTVDTGGSGGGTVADAEWTAGGDVQTAAGRIYFEMRDARGNWGGYVCSGTVTNDSAGDRSVIITAAHCVYDDVNKEFARNVLFIPDQDGTTGSGTDTDCSNDPIGCWAPSFGVVDQDWTTREFPDNIPWDYAYYVVADSGAHQQGITSTSDVLDDAAATLPVSFASPTVGDFTHALGYSYSDDPDFMYCAEDMATEGADNWWLGSCGLSGGSSGGPWVQPMDTATGSGPIMSVNSWGYSNQPGMAGPRLDDSSASCVFDAARTGSANQTRGLVPSGC
jgi:hypothetical protein